MTPAERKCRRKRSYPDLAGAQKEVERVWQHNKQVLWPYLCAVCGRWHITSGDVR